MKLLAFIALLFSLLDVPEEVVVQEERVVNTFTLSSIFQVEQEVEEASKIAFQKEWDSLPSHLKEGVSSIIIAPHINSYCGIETPHKVKGCAMSGSNIIYLDKTYRYGDLQHEAIHIYSYINDRVFSEEFANIYEEEGYNIEVQAGNIHTIYEYFVSAYLLYMNDTLSLQSRCPKTYSYFVRQ